MVTTLALHQIVTHKNNPITYLTVSLKQSYDELLILILPPIFPHLYF